MIVKFKSKIYTINKSMNNMKKKKKKLKSSQINKVPLKILILKNNSKIFRKNSLKVSPIIMYNSIIVVSNKSQVQSISNNKIRKRKKSNQRKSKNKKRKIKINSSSNKIKYRKSKNKLGIIICSSRLGVLKWVRNSLNS